MVKFLFIIFFCFSIFSFAQSRSKDELISLADTKYKMEDFAGAIVEYKKALELDPKDHEILEGLGLSYFKSKNYEKAKEFFRLAILYHGKYAYDYSNLGATYRYLGDDQNAYKYARKALEIEETDLTVYNAASLANNINRPEECLKIMNESKVALHNDFNSLYGRCYYKTKDYKNAIIKFEQFFEKRDPKDIFVDYNMEEEKEFLIMAYLYQLGNKNLSADKIKGLLHKIKENTSMISKENREKMFFIDDNICSKYNYDDATCSQLVKTILGEEFSEVQKINYNYYTIRDHQKAYQLATDYLKKNKNAEIKLLQYQSSLGILANSIINKDIVDEELLQNSQKLFDSFYDKKTYTLQEFKNNEQLRLPVEKTFLFFRSGFFQSAVEQEKIAPTVYEIIKNVPSKEIRDQLKNELLGNK